MRYLLDTSVFLWLRTAPERVRGPVRARLADPAAQLALSVASAFELAFKQSLERLSLPGPVRIWLPQAMLEAQCEALPITIAHALEAALLPLHHRDPFDRFIVAQARVEGLTLVTSDKALSRYEVEILRA